MSRRARRKAGKRGARSGESKRRAAAGAATLVSAAMLWVGAPRVLERVSLFRVRQVEVVGVKNLAPDAVLGALRLPAGASVFADLRLLADRVRGLDGVANATVVRRWPGTLRVRVSEVEPTAFVPGGVGGSLVVVDGAGHPLPFDPERTALDLPVATTADAGVVGVLAIVQSVNPALFQALIGARSWKRDGVLLDLGSRHVLVRRDAGPDVIRAVGLVAQDLAARRRDYTELDARFAGQVIVRRRATAPRAAGRGGA